MKKPWLTPVTILPGLLAIGHASALPVHPKLVSNHAVITTTTTQTTSIPIAQQAKQWGLSVEAYQHYQALMQQEPNQRWYANLDPAEVLGLNATSAEAMRHYAEIEAQVMHQRVTRELTFDRDYRNAYHRRYPQEKAIHATRHASITDVVLKQGDHLWLFININQSLPHQVLTSLLHAVESKGAVLDIYVVGPTVTATKVQQWGAQNHLPTTVVNRSLTLNRGSLRWASMTHGQQQGLPFLAWVHDRHLQPITWPLSPSGHMAS